MGVSIIPASTSSAAYDSSTWNGSGRPPTQDAVRDKVETLVTKASDQIFLTTEAFGSVSGSAAIGVIGGGRYKGWLLDAASSEAVTAVVELPSHVTAIQVDLYWTNAGAGSGNVVFDVNLDRAGNGETLAASEGGGTSGNTTITAPAQDILKVSTLIASVGADESKLLNVRVFRIGGDAADTLANDIALLGVRLLPL